MKTQRTGDTWDRFAFTVGCTRLYHSAGTPRTKKNRRGATPGTRKHNNFVRPEFEHYAGWTIPGGYFRLFSLTKSVPRIAAEEKPALNTILLLHQSQLPPPRAAGKQSKTVRAAAGKNSRGRAGADSWKPCMARITRSARSGHTRQHTGGRVPEKRT